ncbi:hypothetical protein A2U01_0076752, partial [Trifolium medium]|nr:hypothetical protein [Trifolium medium]
PFGTGDVESHVDASVKTAIKLNVESSGNASSEIGKSQSDQIVEETPISNNPKFGETLDESKDNADIITGQSSLSVPVATSDKATLETVDES